MGNEYAPTYKEFDYLFDKIEEDIVYGYIAEKNRKSMLETGYRKFYSEWTEDEIQPEGKFMTLCVYEYVAEGKNISPVLRMKIIPVDKEGRIVQTKEQKKTHERVIKTIQMEDDMIKSGIKIREARTHNKKPNFQPIGITEKEET
jgi:hypothetical protein